MGKTLVIVESPAKARTINKYLSNDYVVKSSVGHIRDLQKSNVFVINKDIISKNIKTKIDRQTTIIKRMGVNPYNDWEANYQIIPGKEKIVSEIRTLAEKADHIYIATDLDREGEAIAWHLQEVIGGNNNRFSRIIFNEITKNKILQAFKQPVQLNINRVNAQQARRFMDRVVGYMVSPLLWKKIARGLSAGRVQSVAVKLIVERERKIKTFIPKEYWKLKANFKTFKDEDLEMEVTHFNDNVFDSNNKDIHNHINLLNKLSYKISKYQKKIINVKPNAPYITSTLQQAANIHLGFSCKKTMFIAQHLYEAGYITYMRTDSTYISQEAIDAVRLYIKKQFSNKYIPKDPINYLNKKNSQEAHEAIRPSNVTLLAENLEGMELDTKKLYQLIWSQFVASQMLPAQYESITLIAIAGKYKLKYRTRILYFDGWVKILQNKKHENHILPDINIGDVLYLKKLIPSQHFTQPLSHFNEASLVKELEKLGIGRPSTYSSIISTIQDRGYIRTKNRRLYIKKIGEIVTDCLEKNFSELMNYNFTAQMENVLDKIASNQAKWKTVLDVFFNNFIKQLNKAEKEPQEGGMQLNNVVLVSINCSVCNRKMGIRTGSTGVFLGCSGYSLSLKNRCKKTINLILEDELTNDLNHDYDKNNNLIIHKHCLKCNIIMDNYITIDGKYKIYICSNNPNCDGYKIEKGRFYIEGNKYLEISCEKCSSRMDLKIGRFGKYISCTNTNCKNIRKILKDGNIAPPTEDPVPFPELLCEKSNDYFVLRNSSTGVFFSASTFPKSRETRSPLVEELKRFSERLPNNLKYLAEAPCTDPDGNKTIIRYNQNKKQQYIVSKKRGRITNWIAFYTKGKWQEIKN
ncbi:DNA topoisomerase I subunit omega [Candidatus Pantoea edessiphila]|uniref:DNA topoisomerase 1 n=1 Tax=Candidatus Pantoea edessiphila TaxID=2044610 RepID=A0A2P5T2L9_9GAMM|nr:type I DNA topoisomerase [Candidatus Pantoea edessiphila]PPI88827.1 DNA topoisomerase I subunit omega [Candidatus Pantoea edessiphila]